MRKFSAAVKTSKVPACKLYRRSKGAGNLEQPTGSSTTTEQPELPWPKQQVPCCLRGQTAWQTEEMSPCLPVRGRKSKIEETRVAVWKGSQKCHGNYSHMWKDIGEQEFRMCLCVVSEGNTLNYQLSVLGLFC